MKILIVNLDKSIFKPGSKSLADLKDYSRFFDKLFVITWTLKDEEPIFFDDRLFIYPTNSLLRLFYIFDTLKIFKDILKKEILGLVSSQDPFETGFTAWLISRIFKIPFHLQIHTDFLSPYFAGESLLNKIRVRIAKFLIPKADGIRVVSKRIKDSLQTTSHKLKAEPLVLPIFVDVEKIKNTPIKTDLRRKYTKFGCIILMAGRLAREKNIDMAIEALAVIAKEYRSTGLVIVGAGPQKKNLAKKAEKLGLKENVSFEEWTDDLASYYKTSDLFLLTSNYEGYGRTLVEAMASGCPVVTTDVGLVGDIIRDRFNAFVVPVKGRQGLYEAVRLLVVSPERAKDLAHAGEQTVRDFPTRDEYLEQYKKSWESCL